MILLHCRSKYINIKENRYFLFLGNICECIFDKQCRFFYQILLEKIVKPLSERKWHRDLNIDFDVFGKYIYIQNIMNVKIKPLLNSTTKYCTKDTHQVVEIQNRDFYQDVYIILNHIKLTIWTICAFRVQNPRQ